MKLPDDARETWRKVVTVVRQAQRRYGLSEVKLGGGTVLAARWNHRRSTDVDVSVTAAENLKHWRRNRRNDLARLTGGTWITEHPGRLSVRTGPGVFDLNTARVNPPEGSRIESVEGIDVEVLSTTQILRGKLNRAHRPGPLRDVFDYVVAAENDPDALANAVGTILEPTMNRIVRTLRGQREEIRRDLNEAIRTDGPRKWTADEIAERVAGIVEGIRTAEVTFRHDPEDRSVTIVRRTRSGTEFTHRVKTGDAALHMERTGIGTYLRNEDLGTPRTRVTQWQKAEPPTERGRSDARARRETGTPQ